MIGPGTQQRVDKDIEIFPQVVGCGDDIAAVAIDPGGKPSRHGTPLVEDWWAVLEISHPQRIGVVARLAAANLRGPDTELAACRSFSFQVAIQRRARNTAARLVDQDSIDDLVTASRLFLLQLDGALQ